MSYTKEQRFNKAYNNAIKYVEQNGNLQKDGSIVWDTWPICVQDKCYDKIVIKDGMLYGVNNTDDVSDWRDISKINHRYVEKLVPDMQKSDAKVKKK